MDAREFLTVVAAWMPGTPSASRTSAMRQFAPRIIAEIGPHALTNECAAAVGRSLGGFPTIDQLVDAIRTNAPGDVARRGGSEKEIMDESWARFVSSRLGEGARRLHLLSLIRAHASPEAVERIMERHYPEDLRQDRLDRAERALDRERKARLPNLRHVAYAQGRPSGPAPPPEPEPPRTAHLTPEQIQASGHRERRI